MIHPITTTIQKSDKVLVPVYDADGEIISREIVTYYYEQVGTFEPDSYNGFTYELKVWVDPYDVLVYRDDVHDEIRKQLGINITNITFVN